MKAVVSRQYGPPDSLAIEELLASRKAIGKLVLTVPG